MNKPNKIKFILEDNTKINEYNESCKMERQWYGEIGGGQVLNIETYYSMCRDFAIAMGFTKDIVNEWFAEDTIDEFFS